jgi:hypothetical protein
MTSSSILRILLKPQLNFILFNFNFSFIFFCWVEFSIELFVNMGYFINVFFVEKLFFTAESRSPAWPCNVELAQPSSKEYDSDYSDNEMDELSVDQMIFYYSRE